MLFSLHVGNVSYCVNLQQSRTIISRFKTFSRCFRITPGQWYVFLVSSLGDCLTSRHTIQFGGDWAKNFSRCEAKNSPGSSRKEISELLRFAALFFQYSFSSSLVNTSNFSCL